jgi:hypothetical protein
LPSVNGGRQGRLSGKGGEPPSQAKKSEDSAEHYSSIPVAQLVSVLDATKAKPERDVRERSSDNDTRQPFQFAHRSLTPTVLPDCKIRGGLQRLRMAEILIFALHLDNLEQPNPKKRIGRGNWPRMNGLSTRDLAAQPEGPWL